MTIQKQQKNGMTVDELKDYLDKFGTYGGDVEVRVGHTEEVVTSIGIRFHTSGANEILLIK